jgi:hypothetical protein
MTAVRGPVPSGSPGGARGTSGAGGPGTIRVIELRNYLIRDGMTHDFIRYFEEHFLFSQREAGMHVLGQFEVADDPTRFVWIRGFDDMAARLRGLSAFYGGPFWQARRSAVNAMILDSDDVHLLRPLEPGAALAGGLSLEDRASEPPGAVPPDGGLVAAELHRTAPGALDRLVERFERHLRPALVERGHQLLGHFVAELAPNDYPRLPATQDPTLLLVLSAYRDAGHWAAMRGGWPGGDPWQAGLAGEARAPLATAVRTLRLRPTARSLIRYRGGGPS